MVLYYLVNELRKSNRQSLYVRYDHAFIEYRPFTFLGGISSDNPQAEGYVWLLLTNTTPVSRHCHIYVPESQKPPQTIPRVRDPDRHWPWRAPSGNTGLALSYIHTNVKFNERKQSVFVHNQFSFSVGIMRKWTANAGCAVGCLVGRRPVGARQQIRFVRRPAISARSIRSRMSLPAHLSRVEPPTIQLVTVTAEFLKCHYPDILHGSF